MREKLKKEGLPFTQIANEVLNDKKLSWKAKGLYSYIYSKPEDWDFSGKRISLDSDDGEKSTYSGLKELEDNGYLIRKKIPGGRTEYYITWSKKPIPQKGKQPKRQTAKTATISNKELNKQRNNTNIYDFSDEKSPVYEEIEKQTYKSKYAIAKQKGIQLKRLPKTDKKRIAEDALNSVSYFREKAMEIHGFKYSEENKQRNAVVLKNAKMIVEKIGLEKTKELIDCYLLEDNSWCNYKPEVCFRMTTLEDFNNKDIKPKGKKEVLQEVGNMRFYSKEEIDKAEKDGRIKWDWKKEKWIANN